MPEDDFGGSPVSGRGTHGLPWSMLPHTPIDVGTFLLVLRMLPAIALIIPVYLMYKALGLTNSYFGLVILYTVVYIPFAVWLLVGFLRDFPVEIEEAAMIDGCSRLGSLVRVVVEVRGMQQQPVVRDRLAQRGDDLRMRVAESVHRDTAEHVEVLPSGVVVQPAARAPDDPQRRPRVGGEEVPRLELEGAVHRRGDSRPVHRSPPRACATRSATTRVPPPAPGVPG